MKNKYDSIIEQITNKYINMYEREIKDIEWVYNQCKSNKEKALQGHDCANAKKFTFLERESYAILSECKEGLEYWKIRKSEMKK